MEDLDLLASLTPRIGMRTLCALGDAACGPVQSALQKFRHEFERHIKNGTCYVNQHPLLAEIH
jgi:NADH-quinone oxidoreductase subunit F